MSRSRACRLKQDTKRPGSFEMRSAECRTPFILPWGNPYIPLCCTRISTQAGGKLPHQRWSQQCPTANHQVWQREHRNKQCFSWLTGNCPQDEPQEQGRLGPIPPTQRKTKNSKQQNSTPSCIGSALVGSVRFLFHPLS